MHTLGVFIATNPELMHNLNVESVCTSLPTLFQTMYETISNTHCQFISFVQVMAEKGVF